ncbi:acyl-CoA dehydrogenase family protein [Novosphingobium mangrovi (ex Huang et al. 2023)]|uniref:Acyl-CoA/acyl-ACP dehydrogenase n=1 Tax=Novosphingobium mangrovi (ex Huang et al. 2023) TaxID=2976432 RepID=A0ABT2I7M0_9SPHN|nr:acyl-CoA dehydrogenase family protein [Novosphingobium mangrovi (ex Huang et al. 2023)]MCT2400542.1 acyl-CoA/acyl-ACP dehydrogenase [Novosphingobium mangrovi (ex Huang et al. 2023)]
MSVLHDEAQRAITEETRRVLAARMDLKRQLELLDSVGEWDEAFWQTAVEQGWTALAVPEEYGGLGLGLIELGLVAQEAGRAIAGAPFLTGGHGTVRALLATDDAAARAHWLPRLAAGEIRCAFAMPQGGRAFQADASVTFTEGRLNGTLSGVVGALAADIAVSCVSGETGSALVLFELADVDRRPIASFDNGRLFADLVLADTPATLLAQGEKADAIAMEAIAQMAVLAAHEQVGGAEALMFAARDYALTRKAFGQPIGAFQSVKHRIAELYGLVEIARANCFHAATREGEADFLEAAACARLTATEAYDTAARDAVQIHGGAGVTWDGGLHLHMRRARSLAIELGHALLWEDLLATELTGVMP